MVPGRETDEDDCDLEEDTSEFLVILLDLETSGFEAVCNILQIAAKCDTNTFATHINLAQQISAKATEAHGLINCSGELLYYLRRK